MTGDDAAPSQVLVPVPRWPANPLNPWRKPIHQSQRRDTADGSDRRKGGSDLIVVRLPCVSHHALCRALSLDLPRIVPAPDIGSTTRDYGIHLHCRTRYRNRKTQTLGASLPPRPVFRFVPIHLAAPWRSFAGTSHLSWRPEFSIATRWVRQWPPDRFDDDRMARLLERNLAIAPTEHKASCHPQKWTTGDDSVPLY